MIEKLYREISEAFQNKKYYRVINLIEVALKIPNFGFNMSLLYKYGYSLMKTCNYEEGIKIYQIISAHDTNEKVKAFVKEVIEKYNKNQSLKLPITDYLAKGYKLESGVVVYLKENNEAGFNNIFPYMIWKIESNKIYAFPIKFYRNHGYILSKKRYFKTRHETVIPELVSFSISDILSIDGKLEAFDYNNTLRDLYQRYCIFGTITNTPKNSFVTEMENKISISVGDIISLYDVNDHTYHYYYILEVNQEESQYKGIMINHIDGEIGIKNGNTIEIPFSSYIVDKLFISPENNKKLELAVSSLRNNYKR